jgi:hypothetical protein
VGHATLTVLQWLQSLRPAIPMSVERPCEAMSNAELRRHIEQGGVLVNGSRCAAQNPAPDRLESLVFFPNGKRRTTLW